MFSDGKFWIILPPIIILSAFAFTVMKFNVATHRAYLIYEVPNELFE